MYRTNFYTRSYEREHQVLTRTIDALLSPFRLLREISPFCIILKICKVIDLSWWIVLGIFVLYEIVDYMTDIIKYTVELRDEKKKEEERAKRAKEFCERERARLKEEEPDIWDLSDAYQDS